MGLSRPTRHARPPRDAACDMRSSPSPSACRTDDSVCMPEKRATFSHSSEGGRLPPGLAERKRVTRRAMRAPRPLYHHAVRVCCPHAAPMLRPCLCAGVWFSFAPCVASCMPRICRAQAQRAQMPQHLHMRMPPLVYAACMPRVCRAHPARAPARHAALPLPLSGALRPPRERASARAPHLPLGPRAVACCVSIFDVLSRAGAGRLPF